MFVLVVRSLMVSRFNEWVKWYWCDPVRRRLNTIPVVFCQDFGIYEMKPISRKPGTSDEHGVPRVLFAKSQVLPSGCFLTLAAKVMRF